MQRKFVAKLMTMTLVAGMIFMSCGTASQEAATTVTETSAEENVANDEGAKDGGKEL